MCQISLDMTNSHCWSSIEADHLLLNDCVDTLWILSSITLHWKHIWRRSFNSQYEQEEWLQRGKPLSLLIWTELFFNIFCFMWAAVFLLQLVSVFLLLLAPVLTCCLPLVLPLDCSDIHNNDNSQLSGVYTIYPIKATSAVQVHFILLLSLNIEKL